MQTDTTDETGARTIVTLEHLGNTFYLRSTVWTGEISRASIFADEEAARAGLARAKPFMKAAQFKAARFRPIE